MILGNRLRAQAIARSGSAAGQILSGVEGRGNRDTIAPSRSARALGPCPSWITRGEHLSVDAATRRPQHPPVGAGGHSAGDAGIHGWIPASHGRGAAVAVEFEQAAHMIRPVSVALLGLAFIVASSIANGFEPTRAAGLSVHLQPERIGRLRGETGGFDVLPQAASERRRLFPDPHALFEFFRRLPSSVRENGIWVVTTNPNAYAD